MVFLYVPFGHVLQGPQSGPVNPTAHGCGGSVVVVGCAVVLVFGRGVLLVS